MSSFAESKCNIQLAKQLCISLENSNIKEIVSLLLNHKVNPNTFIPERGVTPFHLVVGNDSEAFAEEVTKLFLDYGGDPNIKSNDGLTPVHIAVAWGRDKILKLLLERGGNPLCKDEDGLNVFDYSSNSEHNNIIDILNQYCQDAIKQQQKLQFETTSQSMEHDDFLDCLSNESKNSLSYTINSANNTTLTYEIDLQKQRTTKNKERKYSIHLICKDNFIYSFTNSDLLLLKEEWMRLQKCLNYKKVNGKIEESHTIKFIDKEDHFNLNNRHRKTKNNQNTNNVLEELSHSHIEKYNTSQEFENIQRNVSDQNCQQMFLLNHFKNTVVNRYLNFNSLSFETKFDNTSENLTYSEQNKYNNSDNSRCNEMSTAMVSNNQLKLGQNFEDLCRNTIKNENDSVEYNTKCCNENVFQMNKRYSYILSISPNLHNALHQFNSKSLRNVNRFSNSKNENIWLENYNCEKNIIDINKSMTNLVNNYMTHVDSNISNKKFQIQYLNLTDNDMIENKKDCDSLSDYSTRNNISFVTEVEEIESDNYMCIDISEKSRLMDIPTHLLSIDNCTLREQLISFGVKPGPITDSTRNVYLRRLMSLHDSKKNNSSNAENSKRILLSSFHSEIEKNIRYKIKPHLQYGNWVQKLDYYQKLEKSVSKEFANHDHLHKWREGTSQTSFNYILLDSRITQDLPERSKQLTETDVWNVFVTSIFYIGKGKNGRPYAHLYDAFQQWVSKRRQIQNKKVKRILDIWNQGYGIICLHIFHNTIPVEAYTREAAMIEAIGLDKLENCKSGNYYGTIMTTLSSKEKSNFGRYLLYKALQILLQEGERQLFPEHL